MEFQFARGLLPLLLLLIPAACGGEGGEEAAGAEGSGGPRPAGAVSAGTDEAARAGIEILAAGGNAVDAAVAVSLALGVTEPAESGLGGAVTILISPADGPAAVIDGTPPGSASPSPAGEGEATGYDLVRVPTAVRVLETAWREYGSGVVAWEDLVAPAIRLAEEGVPLGRFRHRTLVREYERIRADSAAAALYLDERGTIPTEQSVLPNPALARTLRRLAQEGGGEFYRGRIAETLAEEVRAGGGELTRTDLSGLPAPPVETPLEGSYREWGVLTLPPPHRGEALLRGLRLLDRVPPDTLADRGLQRTQWIAEALRFAALPATSDTSGGEVPTDPGSYLSARPPVMAGTGTDPRDGRRTTHFSVADEAGMAVAVGQSLGGPFGAGILSPELGFFLNRFGRPAGGVGSAPGRGEAVSGVDALGAVLRHPDGDLLVLGSPGGWRGVTATLQVVSGVVDGDRALRDAVGRRRIHWTPGPGGVGTLFLEGTSWSAPVPELGLGPPGSRARGSTRAPSPIPDSVWGDTTREGGTRATRALDRRAAGAALRAEAHGFFGDSAGPVLRRRGFRLGELETGLTFEGRDPWFGRVHAVARIVGVWEAAADPRGDGEGRRLSAEDLAGAAPGGGSR